VTYRYARPVSPDRVAWCWVQQLVRGRPEKAVEFASSDGAWNAERESRRASQRYHQWMRHPETTYTALPPRFVDGDTARVDVVFVCRHSRSSFRTTERLTLRRETTGEWKVCGVTPQD
jgi:hypothetical protein